MNRVRSLAVLIIKKDWKSHFSRVFLFLNDFLMGCSNLKHRSEGKWIVELLCRFKDTKQLQHGLYDLRVVPFVRRLRICYCLCSFFASLSVGNFPFIDLGVFLTLSAQVDSASSRQVFISGRLWIALPSCPTDHRPDRKSRLSCIYLKLGPDWLLWQARYYLIFRP